MKIYCSPELLHLWGPLGIQVYGFFIALAVIITVWLIRKDQRFAALNLEPVYLNITVIGIVAGCIGGRLLEIISEPHLYPEWYDWISVWQGGFSALGAILAVVIITPLYLWKNNIPIIQLCDLVALYAPLLQAIARLGCFTAGCCYGSPTSCVCAVMYTHPESFAPQGILIHPTQLYSSILLFMIFIGLYTVGTKLLKKNGELFAMYLILTSAERCIVDFWRADRIMSAGHFFSFYQYVALAIMICAMIALVLFHRKNTHTQIS